MQSVDKLKEGETASRTHDPARSNEPSSAAIDNKATNDEHKFLEPQTQNNIKEQIGLDAIRIEFQDSVNEDDLVEDENRSP